MTKPAPSPVITRPSNNAGNEGAAPHTIAPIAKNACPQKTGASGPARSVHGPARTIPSSIAVIIDENAKP